MKLNSRHDCFPEKTADHLYRIGLFAQMNRITVKALRFYEEQGLLLPARIDEESGPGLPPIPNRTGDPGGLHLSQGLLRRASPEWTVDS